MKKLLILLFLFGFNSVYAESGNYSTSTVCDYTKSAIDTNNKMVISLYFECISTVTKSDNDLFTVNENSYGNLMANIIRTTKSMDLTGYGTITSATNSNDKIFAENIRKVGDIKTGTGGKGKSKIVGGTGKYAGITGECTYVVSYHSDDKMSSVQECKYKK